MTWLQYNDEKGQILKWGFSYSFPTFIEDLRREALNRRESSTDTLYRKRDPGEAGSTTLERVIVTRMRSRGERSRWYDPSFSTTSFF
jgi:hypothetical protein